MKSCDIIVWQYEGGRVWGMDIMFTLIATNLVSMPAFVVI